MTRGLASLVASGTKLWLDSVDPDLVLEARAAGATGATSNPVIISDLIKTGRFDGRITRLIAARDDDDTIAWLLADDLVRGAEAVFHDVWQSSGGNDGWVSFELDPLIEDPQRGLSEDDRVARYVELGTRWSSGHTNRMIKVPATPAGIRALEPLAAAGVPLNVTLIFTRGQYERARDAVWRGAARRPSLTSFKSVYSVFVSRIDVYVERHVPNLSPAARGMVAIANAKRIWLANQDFWRAHPTPLAQEIVFASTGVKQPGVDPCLYVAALAGADIQTNPPATNRAADDPSRTFTREVDRLPPPAVLSELDAEVDMDRLEEVLMAEGVEKFVAPQKALLAVVAGRR
ncbi:MAG: transaldolase [Planctomycetia bacterium]|nr:transaldolase [Planctomycetia bacterium]